MKSIQSIVRPVVATLVFAFAAAPITAFAGEKAPVAEVKKEKRFPMTAESFNKRIETRITKIREHLSQRLAKSNAPEAKKAEIKKEFEANAAALRAAAAKASADGTVTKEEAKEVRSVAKDLRHKAGVKRGHGKGRSKDRDAK